MDKLRKYGFEVSTDKSTFDDVFTGKQFNEIHIDTYNDKPYMLYSRIIQNNIRIALEDGRIKLRNKDGTVLVDVLFDNIREYAFKKCSNVHQYVLSVCGIWYKVLIVL